MSMSQGLTTSGSQAKSDTPRPAPGVILLTSARAASRPKEWRGAGFSARFSVADGVSAVKPSVADKGTMARARSDWGDVLMVKEDESFLFGIQILTELLWRHRGLDAPGGYVGFGDPEQGIENYFALIGIAPIGMGMATGETEPASAS